MCCHSTPECCVMFSAVKLSMGSFIFLCLPFSLSFSSLVSVSVKIDKVSYRSQITFLKQTSHFEQNCDFWHDIHFKAFEVLQAI